MGTKLGPCILLTYLSLTLIRALVKADERKARLQTRQKEVCTTSTTTTNNNTNAGGSRPSQDPLVMSKVSSIARPYSERTNKMLVAVLLLFLVTEFPTGILGLLSGTLGDNFFTEVYTPLGEVLDILALVNSSINFILYCSMSSVFRQTFCKLFCQPCASSTRIPSTESIEQVKREGRDPGDQRMTTIIHERTTTIIQLKSDDVIDTSL